MANHPFLRAARFTRYLPAFRGLSALLRFYQRFATRDLLRIDDFDGDLKLDVSVCETMGINLWQVPKLFEKDERSAFCSAITPGCNVLDVGANIGIYTLLAAKRGANVYAIEADPENAERLRHNVALNGLSGRIHIFQMAAVDGQRGVRLFRNPGNSGGSNLWRGEGAMEVEGKTIDSLELPPIDVCKMDIEGAELLALEGMTATIARSPRMRLLIECSSEFHGTDQLVAFLREHFESLTPIGRRKRSGWYCNVWASVQRGA